MGLIFAGEIFYVIYFFSFFQITEIKISGNEKVRSEDLTNIIWRETERKILFFPTRSIFLVNSGRIKEEILDRFPQIGETELKRKFPDELDLKAEEREGIGNFCQDDECFLLDRNGIIFENATLTSDLLTIGKAGEGGPPPQLNLGEKVLEEVIISSILEIEAKLKEDLKIPLESVSVVSEERINVKTLMGWEVYFDPQKDLSWQLTKLKAVLEKEIPAEKRKNLEYIELRFGNLAPYKYR